jgi:DNA-binding beta-propeller fold protein YncE
LAVALLLTATTAYAQPEAETVVDGLNNPCGVAIQPNTGHVFVADSGAGRVIRVVDGKVEEVITGFPSDVYGKGPKYNIGPLGLAFLNENTLIVGGGGQSDGEELLRSYEVPKAGEAAIAADKMLASHKLGGTDEIKGEGNFYGVVVAANGVFVTCNGDDTKGWVARAAVDGNKIGPFERYIATKDTTEEVDAPVAIAVMPKTGHIVVGQMGEITKPNDGVLTFYNAKTKKALLNLETNLYDVTGLAYSPKKNRLYALDFAWMAPAEAGLFRLDKKKKDGVQSIVNKKILGLDKPTALAFGADGSLYITVIGTAEEGSDAKPGKLIKLAPGL